MQRIEESELIINSRGAVYHLNLRPEELADIIITVGDPDRVKEVSKHFDSIEVKQQHREFVTHTGIIGSRRVSVVSTGIGPDNIDIVLNELDALANINFESRTVNSELKQLRIIRVGTSGSLQSDIPVDSFVASSHVIGMDNLLHYYEFENNSEEKSIHEHYASHTGATNAYVFSAGIKLLTHFVGGFHHGITVTCPGFYGPQGRVLRLPLKYPTLIDQLTTFAFGNHRITNFEMETSAIYGLGKILGHQCLSLSAIVANRVEKKFSKDGNAAVENLIKQTLERITQL